MVGYRAQAFGLTREQWTCTGSYKPGIELEDKNGITREESD